ncbi:YbdD/YjiX family protein [uncultured Aeromicrobium sp.]|uniref:YbdD/YjiX family protein n=1 Tax=uncultured Aeromicrobium sp. TaxID=337820 RepID=UPI0025EEB095|nr:YbdD/YjiX family protein [uncultured Aeromicrobium sp.]
MIARALEGLRWYLREISGEARWDAYREQCIREGRQPMSRREYERHRAAHREHDQRGRCC